MYFVNRSEIEQILTYMDSLLQEINDKQYASLIEKLGLERLSHTIIESILDVGNLMIDGFIMRDPGSYHDIIDILVDEKVITEQDEASYKAIIDLRQMLVQEYLNIDHKRIKEVLFTNKDVLKQFSHHIRTYLDNELGVANAFSNEP
ncbi:DUF86 domain-containing protein [Pseudogracilibacillus sp. SO30301A]|uniref:DUF86 domain-containing protein n=1 Tax=Pseudogracilibacillus sp. SO30301A TaxID=3098291 RepID=UPI00300E64CD